MLKVKLASKTWSHRTDPHTHTHTYTHTHTGNSHCSMYFLAISISWQLHSKLTSWQLHSNLFQLFWHCFILDQNTCLVLLLVLYACFCTTTSHNVALCNHNEAWLLHCKQHPLKEYTEIREEYYATLIDKKWKTIEQVTNMKYQMVSSVASMKFDWTNQQTADSWDNSILFSPFCTLSCNFPRFPKCSQWSGTGQEAFIGLEQVATCSDTGMALLPNISYGSISYHAIAVLIVAIGQNWHSKWAIPLHHEICLDFSMEFSRDWSHYKIRIFLCDNPISQSCRHNRL